MPKPMPTLADWKVQLLRFTLFPHAPVEDPATIWRDAAGADPEVDENRPREGLRRQVGPYGGAQLETQVTAARVDFILTPAARADGAPTLLDLLPAEDTLAAFRELVRGWLAKKPPLAVRLAVGAVLMLEASDRAAAYEHLARLLKAVAVDQGAMKELFYRVNRPVPSRAAPPMELNRLTSWNSALVRMFAANPVTDGVPIGVTLVERQFVRLEVDTSTPAEGTEPLDGRLLIPIYDELIDLTVENAVRGEVP